MRTLSVSFIAFVVGCFYCGIPNAQTSPYPNVEKIQGALTTYSVLDTSKIKRQDPKALSMLPNANIPASLAMRVHNLRYDFKELKKAREQLLDAQARYELKQKQYKSMMRCNVNQLQGYFKNPQKTWEKLLDRYDTDEKKLSIAINTTDPSVEALSGMLANTPGLTSVLSATEMKDSNAKDESVDLFETADLSETFLMWSLGNGILNDFYYNQDQWSERIDKSLPMTKDQKYLYDNYWYEKYRLMNRGACCSNNCGAGRVVNGIGVPDTFEGNYDYHADYYYYEKTKKAHDKFVTELKARYQCRKRCCPQRASTVYPDKPDRPLPPTNETVLYHAPEFSLDYPPFSEQRLYAGNSLTTKQNAWPKPWLQLIDNGKFGNGWNNSGEMARYFKTKSMKQKDFMDLAGLSVEEQTLWTDSQNNRFNAYQTLKKELDESVKMLIVLKVNYIEVMQNFKSEVNDLNQFIADYAEGNNDDAYRALAQFKLELPKNFDILDHFKVAELDVKDLQDAEAQAEAFEEQSLSRLTEADLEKIQVTPEHVYYQANPTFEFKQYPQEFNVLTGSNLNATQVGQSIGELIVAADGDKLGQVLNKRDTAVGRQDFDLMTDSQIQTMNDNFLKLEEQLIQKVGRDVAANLVFSQNEAIKQTIEKGEEVMTDHVSGTTTKDYKGNETAYPYLKEDTKSANNQSLEKRVEDLSAVRQKLIEKGVDEEVVDKIQERREKQIAQGSVGEATQKLSAKDKAEFNKELNKLSVRGANTQTDTDSHWPLSLGKYGSKGDEKVLSNKEGGAVDPTSPQSIVEALVMDNEDKNADWFITGANAYRKDDMNVEYNAINGLFKAWEGVMKTEEGGIPTESDKTIDMQCLNMGRYK